MPSKNRKSQFLTKQLVELVLHNVVQVVLVAVPITVKVIVETVVKVAVLMGVKENVKENAQEAVLEVVKGLAKADAHMIVKVFVHSIALALVKLLAPMIVMAGAKEAASGNAEEIVVISVCVV